MAFEQTMLTAMLIAMLSIAPCSEAQQTNISDRKVALAHRARGFEFVKKKQFTEAAREFDLAVRADPSDRRFYSDRGRMRFELKDYRNAIADFTVVLNVDRFDRQVQFLRGVAKARMQPADVYGACVDFLAVKQAGNFPDNEASRSDTIARYCAGQPGWFTPNADQGR